jgi:hypothetical protein
MSARVLIGDDIACLYNPLTDIAFGPVFYADHGKTADERAEAFMRFLQIDPRHLSEADLAKQYGAFVVQEERQYAEEEEACRA